MKQIKNPKSSKTTRTVIRVTLLVLVALIIGSNIYALNASRLVGEQVPMPFGVGIAVVLSGSMEPTLSVGDLLFITEQDEYFLDDVVVFQDSGMTVTHRIIEFTEEGVITCGDANNTPDSPLSPDRIKGKVAFSIPLVGYLVNVIKTPLGTLLILALAVFLMERSFHAEKEKDDEKLKLIKEEIEKLKAEQNKKS